MPESPVVLEREGAQLRDDGLVEGLSGGGLVFALAVGLGDRILGDGALIVDLEFGEVHGWACFCGVAFVGIWYKYPSR